MRFSSLITILWLFLAQTQHSIQASKLVKSIVDEKRNGSCFTKSQGSKISTYYINREDQTERRLQTEAMLNRVGLPYKRIAAVHPHSTEYNLSMLEQPCKRNTPTDLSVIMSHLKAIYTAVHDPIQIGDKKRSILDDYALILEDDVKFLYDIDYRALIEKAPRKFGVLQLITTNPEAVDFLWYNFNTAHCDVNATYYNLTTAASTIRNLDQACVDYPTLAKNYTPKPKARKKTRNYGDLDDYIPPDQEFELTPARVHDLKAQTLWKSRQWNDFSRNGRSALYWSAQAYIINRRVAWKFLADILEINEIPAGFSKEKVTFNANRTDNALSFKLVNSFVGHACQRRPERPCILGSCLFSFAYIFSAAQPAYVSQIPLFTGAKIGLESTLHSDQFTEYKKAFGKIKVISKEMRGSKQGMLPEYISPAHSKCL